MKNIFRIFSTIICVALISACDKEDPQDAFGNTTTPSNPVQAYMTNIVDELTTDNLKELELALKASLEGGLGKYFYETNNKDLTEDGSIWTVKREGNMTGLVIKKVSGIHAWELSYSGKYSFSGNDFETSSTITAEQVDPTATSHQSWNVTIDGTRTEEEGYSCSFSSVDAPILFKTIPDTDSQVWNAFGYLLMTVFKDGSQIDKVVMELAGGKSDSSIVRL